MDVKDFDLTFVDAVENAIRIPQQRDDAGLRQLLDDVSAFGPAANSSDDGTDALLDGPTSDG